MPITIGGVSDAEGDTIAITIASVRQDEPTDTFGDGKFSLDGDGVGTDTVSVRAERSGTKRVPGDGRVYYITYSADDGHGGVCAGTASVGGSHDQGKGGTPVDGGPLYDSTVAWHRPAAAFNG